MRHLLDGLDLPGRPARGATAPHASRSGRCTPNQDRYLLASVGNGQSYYLPLSFALPPSVAVPRLRAAVERVVSETPALGGGLLA